MSQAATPAAAGSSSPLLQPDETVIAEIEAACRARGEAPIDAQAGRVLRVLAAAAGARRVLEIGSGGGASALWLVGALPADGLLLTMEQDAARVAAARAAFERTGTSAQISVIAGDARRFLHKVAGPFDVVLADADPALHAAILDRLVGHLRPGGLLVTARMASPGDDEYGRRLTTDPRLLTTFIAVGEGLALSVRIR